MKILKGRNLHINVSTFSIKGAPASTSGVGAIDQLWIQPTFRRSALTSLEPGPRYHKHVKDDYLSFFPPHHCARQRARASLSFSSRLSFPTTLNLPLAILVHERLRTVPDRQDRYFPLSEPQFRERPHRNCSLNHPYRK